VRVRHHGEVARLEVDAADFDRVLGQREIIVEQLKAIGYTFTALDLTGYKMGSLNQLSHQQTGISMKVAHGS
jgi:pyridinium-3,5-biscarboxylic acid mononucleotide sulfurtransferase